MLSSTAQLSAATAPTLFTRTANASNFFSGFTNNLPHLFCPLRLAVELRAHVSKFLGGLSAVVLQAYQRLTTQVTTTNLLFPWRTKGDEPFPKPLGVVSKPFAVIS